MSVKISAQIAVVLGTLLVSVPRYSHAQSSNQVAAEALFREARKLLDAGQFREACDKLEASRRLDPAAGTLLNLARCREKLGQTATAWAAYHEAIRAAKATGQTEREKVARERAAALEPTLPRMTVTVSAEARAVNAQVRRDGVIVPQELWGVTVPVDPGEHSVDATAAGKKPWGIKANLQERGVANITVPALESVAASPGAGQEIGGARTGSSASVQAPAPVNTSGETPSKAPNSLVTADAQKSSWTAGKTVALVLAGVGVAGLTVGTLEWLRFEQKKDDAESVCPSSGCYDAQHDTAAAYLAEADTARKIAIAGGAIGGASLVGAAIVWFASSSGTSGTDALAITPVVGMRGFGLDLRGAW